MPKGRERRLGRGEELALLEACDRSASVWLGPVVRLAMATAMRQGELVALTWQQVRLADRTILLTDTKNGETRTIPLSTAAIPSVCSMKISKLPV
jgi:integrase